MGWDPVYPDENLGVMSIGFLLQKKTDAIIWRGPRKNGIFYNSYSVLFLLGLIKQFLTDVLWENVDMLIIDCMFINFDINNNIFV